MNLLVWSMLISALVLAWSMRADQDYPEDRPKDKDDLTKRQ